MDTVSYFPDIVDMRMRDAFVRCPAAFRYQFCDKRMTKSKLEWLDDDMRFESLLRSARVGSRETGSATSIKQALHGSRTTRGRPFDAAFAYEKLWPVGADGFMPYSNGSRSMIGEVGLFALPVNHPVSQKPLKLAVYIPYLGVEQLTGTVTAIHERMVRFARGPQFEAISSEAMAVAWACAEFAQLDSLMLEMREVRLSSKHDPECVLRQVFITAGMFSRWHAQICRDVARMVQAYSRMAWDERLDMSCADCAYRSVTYSENREDALQSYKRVEWLPLTRQRQLL